MHEDGYEDDYIMNKVSPFFSIIKIINFFTPRFSKYKIDVIKSRYGRDHGWYLILQGRKIAVLSYRFSGDMFWDVYEFKTIVYDFNIVEMLSSDDFWRLQKYRFQNCRFENEIVDRSSGHIDKRNSVSIRSLYIYCDAPNLLEYLLCFRTIRRARKRMEHPSEAPDTSRNLK